MITPARINDISNEIATIYAHISDELLVNIGKHITSPNWTHTASWEIQKLAELGQLTAENAAIINKWIKAIPPELRNAMEETRKAALDEIEKQMDAAAKNGYVTPPVTDSTVEIFRDMQNQAADRLNLVNTTMLQSSVDQYQRAITLTQQEYDRLMAQQEATQRALNEGAGSVASGVETRRVAVRRAIGRISAEGLTGFVDRAGRHWTPEAYVNMDVRTTVHNTAIQATRARMNDFGTSVFQVSSHAGARPLCYPYQGKFYSWDNASGTIELGDGSVVSYEPINSTSYGQPAGVFGVNCQHYPIPIIAGVTIPHGADNIQPEEEHDKACALSQEQRALERKIREAKRLVEMAGDSATPEDKQKVKDAQAQMREFIAKTGRTRRYDREQIGGTPNVKPAAEPENVNQQLTIEPVKDNRIVFERANTIAEAETFARDTIGVPNVSFKGVDLDVANAMNESLTSAVNYSPTIMDRMGFYGSAQERNKMLKADLEAYWTQYFVGQGYSQRIAESRAKQWASSMVGRVAGNTYALAYSGEISSSGNKYDGLADVVKRYAGVAVNNKHAGSYAAMTASLERDVSIGWHPVGTGTVRATFDHEFGHQLDYAFDLANNPDILEYRRGMKKDDVIDGLSEYATKNIQEFIAEAYAEYVNNPTPRPTAQFVGGIIDQKAGENNG